VRPLEPGANGGARSHDASDRDGGVSKEDGFQLTSRISVLAVASTGLPCLSLLLFLLSGNRGGGWTGLTFFLLPTSVVLGIEALSLIRESGGRLRGRGFAIGGIVLGVAGTLSIGLVILVFGNIMRCFEGC